MPALLPSELPVLARASRHWIVLLRPPRRIWLLLFAGLLIAAMIGPAPLAWLFLIAVAAAVYLRVQTWRSDAVVLTRRRIVRVRGIAETGRSEASLRLDRVSGVLLSQSVLAKILDYGTVELEAPGHTDVRRIEHLAHPYHFYRSVHAALFDDEPPEYVDDAPPAPRRRPPGRHHGWAPPDEDAPLLRTAPLPRLPKLPRRIR